MFKKRSSNVRLYYIIQLRYEYENTIWDHALAAHTIYDQLKKNKRLPISTTYFTRIELKRLDDEWLQKQESYNYCRLTLTMFPGNGRPTEACGQDSSTADDARTAISSVMPYSVNSRLRKHACTVGSEYMKPLTTLPTDLARQTNSQTQ